MVSVRPYTANDVAAMVEVWNEVVRGGTAFPQEEELDAVSGAAFFATQTHCGVAVEDGAVLGLYILHPNNVAGVGTSPTRATPCPPLRAGRASAVRW